MQSLTRISKRPALLFPLMLFAIAAVARLDVDPSLLFWRYAMECAIPIAFFCWLLWQTPPANDLKSADLSVVSGIGLVTVMIMFYLTAQLLMYFSKTVFV